MLKMFIMQGIPGSGKSRFVRRLAPAWVCSADSYPGLYTDAGFDSSKLGKAHTFCFKQAMLALQGGASVVIDNTNLNVIEVSPYIALGKAFDCTIEIIRVRCPQLVAYRRQTHGVPLALHRKMAQRFKSFVAPAYWEVRVREV
jgi:predicted kinase